MDKVDRGKVESCSRIKDGNVGLPVRKDKCEGVRWIILRICLIWVLMCRLLSSRVALVVFRKDNYFGEGRKWSKNEKVANNDGL